MSDTPKLDDPKLEKLLYAYDSEVQGEFSSKFATATRNEFTVRESRKAIVEYVASISLTPGEAAQAADAIEYMVRRFLPSQETLSTIAKLRALAEEDKSNV